MHVRHLQMAKSPLVLSHRLQWSANPLPLWSAEAVRKPQVLLLGSEGDLQVLPGQSEMG
jgi:hypothetical protein